MIKKTYGRNTPNSILREVIGVLTLVIVMAAYTGVVAAQGMDVSLSPTEGVPGTSIPLPPPAPTRAVAPTLTSINGESFGTTTDKKGLHHYASFRIDPPRKGSWRVECPGIVVGLSFFADFLRPASQRGKPPCSVWDQESEYYVLAGFQWPDPDMFPWLDPNYLNPYLLMKPSDFQLYLQ